MSDQQLSQTENARSLELLQQMLLMHVHEHVDCEDCVRAMDCVADLAAAGRSPDKAFSAIMAHIKCCPHCNEEYYALVKVLIAIRTGTA